MRDAFPSKGAILGGFSRRIDRMVLDGTTERSRGRKRQGPAVRRADAPVRRLKPHKAALDNIETWAVRDPLALVELNRLAINSMRYMLEAAGVSSEGPLGPVKLQGLVVAWTRTLRVWLADESADSARTMSALDKALERGRVWSERLDETRRTLAPLANPLFGLAERVLGAR